jgi:SAM-dependent methyltransferase
MPSWLIKAGLQNVMGLTPRPDALNYLFQKHVTHSVTLNEEWFEKKVRQVHRHLEKYRELTGILVPAQVLEIGTGWHPIVPIGFFLSGARGVTTVDIADLLRPETVGETIRWICDYADRGALTDLLPSVLPERLEVLRRISASASTSSVPAMLQPLSIQALVRDARSLPFEDASIDLIVSNNTFEHIKTDVLGDVIKELRRVIRADGVNSHYIDMSDHYSHFDESISNWHFLRYSDLVWKILDSPIVPQNRLRISDHRAIHRAAQFRIVEEVQEHIRNELPPSTPLSARFQEYELADLLVTHCWVVSLPALDLGISLAHSTVRKSTSRHHGN